MHSQCRAVALAHGVKRRNFTLGTTLQHTRQPRFPPRELRKSKPTSDNEGAAPSSNISPELWAALQLPPASALSAFSHRVGLGTILDTPERVQQICIHPTYLPFYTQHRSKEKEKETLRSNGALSSLGNSLFGLFASEHLHASYPHLPTRVLKAAVTAYAGPATCASVARQMGAGPLLRWRRMGHTLTQPAILHEDALASIPRSIAAVLYREKSLSVARKFFEDFFLSRELDMRLFLKFRDPKLALRETVEYFNREPPKSRLLKETGRLSSSPIFVVGIFSGADKLGEGHGTSLRMAEYRAAEDSLQRLYLTRHPPHLIQAPSSTFGADVFDLSQPPVPYTPPLLGHSEVLLGSAGRGGRIADQSEFPEREHHLNVEDREL